MSGYYCIKAWLCYEDCTDCYDPTVSCDYVSDPSIYPYCDHEPGEPDWYYYEIVGGPYSSKSQCLSYCVGDGPSDSPSPSP